VNGKRTTQSATTTQIRCPRRLFTVKNLSCSCRLLLVRTITSMVTIVETCRSIFFLLRKRRNQFLHRPDSTRNLYSTQQQHQPTSRTSSDPESYQHTSQLSQISTTYEKTVALRLAPQPPLTFLAPGSTPETSSTNPPQPQRCPQLGIHRRSTYDERALMCDALSRFTLAHRACARTTSRISLAC